MKNTFLEKSYTKCSGETIPRPFSKEIKIEYICGSICGSCCCKFYSEENKHIAVNRLLIGEAELYSKEHMKKIYKNRR